MARLIYALNQSLDGFVDHDAFAPDRALFLHFIEDMRGLAGVLHGRRMYETMRYWDEDGPDWGDDERAYAAAWRSQPKWVVSSTLASVGPNATLLAGDLETAVRDLKGRIEGDIEVAGPELASGLSDLGLIDEYRIYLHPYVVGHGKRYFAKPRPPLRLVGHERIGDQAIQLRYVPA